MFKKGRKYLLVFMFLVVLILFSVTSIAPPINLNILKNLGISGMEINEIKIESQEYSEIKIEPNDKIEIGGFEVKFDELVIFEEKTIQNKKQIKQLIDLRILDNVTFLNPINFSQKVIIDYNEIRWNGTRYILNSKPVRLTSWNDSNGLIVPNIFFDDIYHKRINYKDIALKGGYALAYNDTINNIIELRIDNIDVAFLVDYIIDPEYINATGGFDIAGAGAGNSDDITSNGSDFWIVDSLDDFVYHFDSSGNNLTDGFYIGDSGAENVQGITTNNSDFWIVDSLDDFVYHFDSSGNNLTDGFNILGAGASAATGIVIKDGDFWIVETDDDFVYHFVLSSN